MDSKLNDMLTTGRALARELRDTTGAHKWRALCSCTLHMADAIDHLVSVGDENERKIRALQEDNRREYSDLQRHDAYAYAEAQRLRDELRGLLRATAAYSDDIGTTLTQAEIHQRISEILASPFV